MDSKYLNGNINVLTNPHGRVVEMEPISVAVDTMNNKRQYIRINTVENGVSWTSWREIEIYGY